MAKKKARKNKAAGDKRVQKRREKLKRKRSQRAKLAAKEHAHFLLVEEKFARKKSDFRDLIR